MDSQRCNNSDTDWYVWMPTNPLGGVPQVEMQLKLYKEEDAILE